MLAALRQTIYCRPLEVRQNAELSTAFYALVAKDPILRPLFPGKTFNCAIEEFAEFLAQFLGPPSEARRGWWLSLRESHLRFQIGEKERNAWVGIMRRALDEVAISEPVRSALWAFFEEASAYLVNTSPVVATQNAGPALWICTR